MGESSELEVFLVGLLVFVLFWINVFFTAVELKRKERELAKMENADEERLL